MRNRTIWRKNDVLRQAIRTGGWSAVLALCALHLPNTTSPDMPIQWYEAIIASAFRTGHFVAFSSTVLLLAIVSRTRHSPYRIPLLVIGDILCGLGLLQWVLSPQLLDVTPTLALVNGSYLGVGSSCLLLVWLRSFSDEGIEKSVQTLLWGAIVSAIVYAVVHFLPQRAESLIVLTVIFPLAAFSSAREQRRFDSAEGNRIECDRIKVGNKPGLIRSLLAGGLYLGSLLFACGVSFDFSDTQYHQEVLLHTLAVIVLVVVGTVLLFGDRPSRLRIEPAPLFQMIYPLALVLFALIPLVPAEHAWLFGSIFTVAFSPVAVLLIMYCLQVARDYCEDPVFVFGTVGGFSYLLHFLGLTLGNMNDDIHLESASHLAFITLAITLLFGLGLTVALRSFGWKQGEQAASCVNAHCPIGVRSMFANEVNCDGHSNTRFCEGENGSASLELRVKTLALKYALSDRECQVVESLARGNGVTRTAEVLTVSESTVQTYVRRIYAKLGIHKRQELFDILYDHGRD